MDQRKNFDKTMRNGVNIKSILRSKTVPVWHT